MPFNFRPGIGKSRGVVAPVVKRSASFSAMSLFTSNVSPEPSPTLIPVLNSIPSCWRRWIRRSTTDLLSSFMLGIPYINKPPIRSARSYTITEWPTRFSCAAAAKPAGPDPTMAIDFPVRESGGCGFTHPSSKPRSMIAISIFLMATGGSVIPSTQLPSQGAGHTRPVNSGKLLVACNRSRASRHWPLYTRSFHSGIRLCVGQPALPIRCSRGAFDWQKGTPQSMQRAPCFSRWAMPGCV